MDPDRYLAHLESLIDDCGVAIVFVGQGDGSPAFSYTVGLSLVDEPEVIVFGAPRALAQDLLNDVAFSVLRAGLRFSEGDRIHRLIQDAHAILIDVEDPEAYLFMAYDIRDRRLPDHAGLAVPALQLVLPDAHDRWPWDAGSTTAHLPILGHPPASGTGRDVALPPADQRRDQGW